MEVILGISAFYHDSAASLLVDGEIIAAVKEERFSRKKNTPDFPSEAIIFCLNEAKLEISDLTAIVYFEKPFLKFERLLETYFETAPKGVVSFLKAIPKFLSQKLFIKRTIKEELEKCFDSKDIKTPILFSKHHLSHAASAFYCSEFKEAAILTVDGVGEWDTTTISRGKQNKIIPLKTQNFPNSIGLLYSSFTYFLGFEVNSGEYKLMGLAPYGNIKATQTKQFIQSIKNILININEDGSIILDQKYFNFMGGLKMIHTKRWEQLFKLKRRKEHEHITQMHCNLAIAIQTVTEEILLALVSETKRLTLSDNLCLSGGVALNCVANGKILRSKIFKNIYIQPAAGDAGGALGAALATHFMYFDNERTIKTNSIKGTYLGPSYSDTEIKVLCHRVSAEAKYFEDFEQLTDKVSGLISSGQIVGWFQDKMEFGPRALGNRSILGCAQNISTQTIMNLKIKKRESFRPFAPAVLEEDSQELFDIDRPLPFMQYTATLKHKYLCNLPSDFADFCMNQKLTFKKSEFPAITHVDLSSRIQTVSKDVNKKFWTLLKKVKRDTGFGIVANTSFNVKNEPIVCSPLDAYICYKNTEMDSLVLGNFLLEKKPI